MSSGPTQDAFMRKCAAVGCKPKVHFGVTLNGKDAIKFLETDFSDFWTEHLTDNR